MLHFFRKIRRDLLANSQFFKYLKYAVGEIVLVVLGILIALYINNQNEQRKEQEKFDQILVEVEKELIHNISWARGTIENFSRIDAVFLQILVDKEGCERPALYWNVFSVGRPPSIEDDFYQKLLQLNDLSLEQETILDQLTHLSRTVHYTSERWDQIIEIQNTREKKLGEYDWYDQYLWKEFNDYRILDFVTNDPEYRKMATIGFGGMAAYKSSLSHYDIVAVPVYRKIRKYLDSIGIRNRDSLSIEYNPYEYEQLLGKYDSKWCSNPAFVHDDSIAVDIEDEKLIWYGYRSRGAHTRTTLIPINKDKFRDDKSGGIYHLQYDDQGNAKGIRFSMGPHFVLDLEKVH